MGAACLRAHLKLGSGVFQLKFIGVRPSPPPPLHLIMDSWKITTKFSNVSKTVTNLIWPLISKLYTMGFKFDHYKSHHRELRMLGLSGQVKDQLRTKSISRVSLFSSRWLQVSYPAANVIIPTQFQGSEIYLIHWNCHQVCVYFTKWLTSLN